MDFHFLLLLRTCTLSTPTDMSASAFRVGSKKEVLSTLRSIIRLHKHRATASSTLHQSIVTHIIQHVRPRFWAGSGYGKLSGI